MKQIVQLKLSRLLETDPSQVNSDELDAAYEEFVQAVIPGDYETEANMVSHCRRLIYARTEIKVLIRFYGPGEKWGNTFPLSSQSPVFCFRTSQAYQKVY